MATHFWLTIVIFENVLCSFEGYKADRTSLSLRSLPRVQQGSLSHLDARCRPFAHLPLLNRFLFFSLMKAELKGSLLLASQGFLGMVSLSETFASIRPPEL